LYATLGPLKIEKLRKYAILRLLLREKLRRKYEVDVQGKMSSRYMVFITNGARTERH